jgi:hypothetical protein
MNTSSKKENSMQGRSRDPRSAAEQEAERRAFAGEAGTSVDDIQAIEEALRKTPINYLLEELYGPDHGAFYDEGEDLWIVPDTKHVGPGFGFIALRSDRSWFAGVVNPKAFQ